MSVLPGAHWLAFLWSLSPGEGDKLKEAVQKAKASGATVFELMPPMLNQMPVQETAQALKDGGITKAVMCHFYPPGAIGDPLVHGEEFSKAIAAFKDVIAYMKELRTHGITIDLIVGPSCFVLSKDYGWSDTDLCFRIRRFFCAHTEALKEAKMRVAIELLRDVEDKVVRTIENSNAILEGLPADVYGFHLDTFHLRDREINIVAAIKQLGKRIFHVHANGTGRVPPGHDQDDIKWPPIVAALKEVGFNGIATNEPFCEEVRQAEPSLGEGLPPAMPEPEGLKMTVDNLTALGLFS